MLALTSRQNAPLVSHGANLFNLCPFRDSSALYATFILNWSSRLTTFPSLLNRGANCFLPIDVHSQMNPQTCTKFGANRSSRLAAFPYFNLRPPKTTRNAPWGIEGRILFSLYVHSQTNPHT